MYYRFLAMLSHCFTGLCRVAVSLTYTYRISFEVDNPYNIVFLKFSFDGGDADR